MKIAEIFYSVQGEGTLVGGSQRVRAHVGVQFALHVVRYAVYVVEA